MTALRWVRHGIVLLAVAGAAAFTSSRQSVVAAECRSAIVTAYAAQDFPGLTASGVRTGPHVGAIVAGGGAYELGQTVHIEGLGSYTVEDRGRLGHTQIDLLLATRAEAIDWGRQVREVCV